MQKFSISITIRLRFFCTFAARNRKGGFRQYKYWIKTKKKGKGYL